MDLINETLQSLGFDQYINLFVENDVTDDVMSLVATDSSYFSLLSDVIPTAGHRIRILDKYKQLKEKLTHDSSSTPKVTCPLCSTELTPNWTAIWAHLKLTHCYTSRSKNFPCAVCKTTVQWYKSFKSHFLKQHEAVEFTSDEVIKSPKNENFTEKQASPINEAEGFRTHFLPRVSLVDIQQSSAKFVVRLQSSGRLPLSLSSEIIDSTKDLISDILDLLTHELKIVIEPDASLNNVWRLIDDLRNPFVHVSSQFRLEKYLQKQEVLIPSVEVVLGTRVQNIQKNNETLTTEVTDIFRAVPLRQTLKKLLEFPGVIESVKNWSHTTFQTTKVYSSPACGSYFRQRNQDKVTPTVYLLLYFDELEICNPIGSRAGMHKLGLFYCTVLNINPQFNSRVDNIMLMGCVKSKFLKKYGINDILKTSIQELNHLHEAGINISTESFTGNVKIELGQVIGDNLGVHMLFGLTESFMANYPCRFCRMPKCMTQIAGSSQEILLRNRQNYERDLLTDSISHTGIKQSTIFNELPYFHITENFCPDLMHDILEGVAPLDIKLLLIRILDSKSLAQINSRINEFNYGHLRKDKPSPLGLGNVKMTDTCLGQSASQTLCLVRFFPLIFGDLFDSGDDHWNLLISLEEILDIILAPSVSDSTLYYLQELISDHHELYRKLSGLPLRPKHHHLTHYVDAIRKVGPLTRYWVIRYEAKHRFFKHISQICCNFRNIVKTVTDRHQLYMSYKYILRKEFDPESFDLKNPISICVAEMEYAEELVQNITHCDLEHLFVSNLICYAGSDIRSGDLILQNWSEGGPDFVKVHTIFNYRGKPFIIGQPILTDYFDTHYHAYVLKENVGQCNVKIIPLLEIELPKGLSFSRNFIEESSHQFVQITDELLSEQSMESKEQESTNPNESVSVLFLSPFNSNPAYEESQRNEYTISTTGTLTPIHTTQRISKRRRLDSEFPTEALVFMDIKTILNETDKECRTNCGSKIIELSEQRKPLTLTLRKILVRRVCQALMKKADSDYPSTDLRRKAANCIATQLYNYLPQIDAISIQESYFTPSTTYPVHVDGKIKMKSRTPTGYIQSFLKNHWSSLKTDNANVTTVVETETEIADTITEDEFLEMKKWLQQNRAPVQRIFEYLYKTHPRRHKIMLTTGEHTIDSLVSDWPRLFDTDGAMCNDFQWQYPLVSDSLIRKWNSTAKKLLLYAENMKKGLSDIGITKIELNEGELTMAAFFILPYLIRSRVRKLTQIECISHFVKVVGVHEDTQRICLDEVTRFLPYVLVKGVLSTLEFEEYFAVVGSRTLKCTTMLEAVDLCYKSYYVLNLPFPEACFGAWQLIDYSLFTMEQKIPISPTVKEISVFVSENM